MSEEAYWREQKCGCRYLVGRVPGRYLDRYQVIDIEYCDECFRRVVFIDYLSGTAREKRRLLNKMDDAMKEYVRQREKGLADAQKS